MEDYRLGEVERRFADLIWANAPLPSGELVRLCQGELGWKKSTSYTVLKKLSGRGFVKNEGAVVMALVQREEVQRYESESLVDKSFGGSLPAFLTAFLRDRRLTREEAEEIRRMIDEAVKDD